MVASQRILVFLVGFIILHSVLSLPSEEQIKQFENWYKTQNPWFSKDAVVDIEDLQYKADLQNEKGDFWWLEDTEDEAQNAENKADSDADDEDWTTWDRDRITLGSTSEQQFRPGVYATKPIKKGDIILTIPKSLIVSFSDIMLHDYVGDLAHKLWMYYSLGTMFDPGYYEAIHIWVLFEKYYAQNHPEFASDPRNTWDVGYWKLWLESKEMNNILFFKFAELRELIGSPLHKRAMDRRTEFKEHFDWLLDNIIRAYPRVFKEEPSEEQYKWSVSVSRSTNFQIKIPERKDAYSLQPAIVPFLDKFRHAPVNSQNANYFYDIEGKQFIVQATANINPGDEITVSWGPKCNSELLDFHGFIIEDNPDDCVHMTVEVNPIDPMQNSKNVLLKSEKIDPADLKLVKGGLTAQLLTAARIATLDPHDWRLDFVFGGFPKGTHADLAVADFLLKQCRKQYTAYPTSIDEDTEALKEEGLSQRKQLAIKVRLGEKDILRSMGSYYYEELDKLAQLLQEEIQDGLHDEL